MPKVNCCALGLALAFAAGLLLAGAVSSEPVVAARPGPAAAASSVAPG